jgi:hypothetical protein
MASVTDAAAEYTGEHYEFSNLTFSLKYTYNGCTIYSRWYQDPPDLASRYWFEENHASSKVLGMRILDSLSLFMGRR